MGTSFNRPWGKAMGSRKTLKSIWSRLLAFFGIFSWWLDFNRHKQQFKGRFWRIGHIHLLYCTATLHQKQKQRDWGRVMLEEQKRCKKVRGESCEYRKVVVRKMAWYRGYFKKSMQFAYLMPTFLRSHQKDTLPQKVWPTLASLRDHRRWYSTHQFAT